MMGLNETEMQSIKDAPYISVCTHRNTKQKCLRWHDGSNVRFLCINGQFVDEFECDKVGVLYWPNREIELNALLQQLRELAKDLKNEWFDSNIVQAWRMASFATAEKLEAIIEGSKKI